MLLLRAGPAGRPVGVAVADLAVVGLLLPLSPVGAMLSMSALPPRYYGLVGVVLGLYAGCLRLARRPRGHSSPSGD